jgi:hypothetical protein
VRQVVVTDWHANSLLTCADYRQAWLSAGQQKGRSVSGLG